MTQAASCAKVFLGEERPAKPDKSIQWIDLSDERRSAARQARHEAGTPRA
ncbi:MAG TPA: hypothetical protein VJM79_03185 [Rhizorhapis sp.]|nr:hypothetical protein [Rhizorhapis sp.]